MLKLEVKKRTKLNFNSDDFGLLVKDNFSNIYDEAAKTNFLHWEQTDGTDYSGSINFVLKPKTMYEFQIRAEDRKAHPFGTTGGGTSDVNVSFEIISDSGSVLASTVLNSIETRPGEVTKFLTYHPDQVDGKTLNWKLISDVGAIDFILKSLTVIEKYSTPLEILDAEKGIQITRSIKEISAPDKYKRGFTNEFKIVVNDNINDYLNFVNKKSNSSIIFDAIISDENYTLMEGSLKLSDITSSINGKDVISAQFFENGFEFFEQLKTTNLKELVKYNVFATGHEADGFDNDRYVTVNYTNIKDMGNPPQWFIDNNKWIYYSIVNNGNIPHTIAGRGMNEAIRDGEKVPGFTSSFSVNDYYPSIPVWKIWKELHDKLGYTYEGDDFFDTDQWKGLLYNYWKDYVYSKETININTASGKFAGYGNKILIEAVSGNKVKIKLFHDTYGFYGFATDAKLQSPISGLLNEKILNFELDSTNPLYYGWVELEDIPSWYDLTDSYINLGSANEASWFITRMGYQSINAHVFLENTTGPIDDYYLNQNMAIPGSGLNLHEYNFNMKTEVKAKLKISLKTGDTNYSYLDTIDGTIETLRMKGTVKVKIGYDEWGSESDNQFLLLKEVEYDLRNYEPYSETLEFDLSSEIDYNFIQQEKQLKIYVYINNTNFDHSYQNNLDKLLKVTVSGNIKFIPHQKIAPDTRYGWVGNNGNENLNTIVDNKPLMNFYKNVLSLFNMRFIIDEKRKKISYFTFDEYYIKNSKVKDFTNKFDVKKVKRNFGNSFQANSYLFQYKKTPNYFDNQFGKDEKSLTGELSTKQIKIELGYGLVPYEMFMGGIPLTLNYSLDPGTFISSAPSRHIGEQAFFSYMNTTNNLLILLDEDHLIHYLGTIPTQSPICTLIRTPLPVTLLDDHFQSSKNNWILTEAVGGNTVYQAATDAIKLTTYADSDGPTLSKSIAMTAGTTYQFIINITKTQWGNPQIYSIFDGEIISKDINTSGEYLFEYIPTLDLTEFELVFHTDSGTQFYINNIKLIEKPANIEIPTTALMFRDDELLNAFNPITFNHYELFFKNEYKDIIKKSAETIDVNIKLSNAEFVNLKLNDIIRIVDNMYRIDKIGNFNEHKLTTLSLIKISFNPMYYGTVLNPSKIIWLDPDHGGFGNVTVPAIFYTSGESSFELNYKNVDSDITIEYLIENPIPGITYSSYYQFSWDGGTTWNVITNSQQVVIPLSTITDGTLNIKYKLVSAPSEYRLGRLHSDTFRFTSDFVNTGIDSDLQLTTRITRSTIPVGGTITVISSPTNISSNGSGTGDTSSITVKDPNKKLKLS